jgi:Fatty acid desaturase
VTPNLLRYSARDASLVVLAAAYGAVLLAAPAAPVIALGLWWSANTIAHNFIHHPFFRVRAANRAFSVYLSLLLGLPQTLWRDRHLAHHAERAWRLRLTRQLAFEIVAVAVLWIALAWASPAFFLDSWLPGWLGGLAICQLQGYYEHVRGTVSHHGRLYNFAFFNDGFHVEHHAHPTRHWTELPRYADRDAPESRWPAVLRWLERCNLDGLERLVLRSRRLQRYVVQRHTRAFRKLLATLPATRRVTVVGGGLFPRTMLVLRQLLPAAEITIVDRSGENLEVARGFFDGDVHTIEADYVPQHCVGIDLLVVPLAFRGDRSAFYLNPPAPAVAVHDWIWRRRGTGYVVSFLMLKRLNLVRR